MEISKVKMTLIMVITVMVTACTHEPYVKPQEITTDSLGNFPPDIGRIIVSRCATAGCHNSLSYQNAAGLRLDSWEALFDGSVSGAVIVPYSPENSSMLFFINPDPDLGPTAVPQMPLNMAALTKDEYLRIRDWVTAGAPDKNGNIPFGSNISGRSKIYLTNQGCDLVAVIDAEKKVVMRYIKVGRSNGIEVAHYLKTSSDGYAYVSFTGGEYLQKIDMEKDTVVSDVFLGPGSWNAIHISEDGKKLLIGDYSGGGKLAFINTTSMTIDQLVDFGIMPYPHGIASNRSFDTFYVTAQYGNYVWKFSFGNTPFFEQLSIDGMEPNTLPSRNPHEIMMAPDYSKYFLTCDKSNEVRVMSTSTDEVIDSISVGVFPQTMALSKSKPYLFVTCSEDYSSFSGFRGSVYVINYNTHEVVKKIDAQFYQPHGISVDEKNGLLFVGNRNVDVNGPAPHHTSSCGGRNGYYIVFDLNTLEKLPKRYEVSVDPYSSDTRFK
jgi:DNA-binding beta-propeller fold protein YncE